MRAFNNAPSPGDLVKHLMHGSPEHGLHGIVLERICYGDPAEIIDASKLHRDEFSCIVLFPCGQRVVRAKWLKVLSKKA